MKVSYKIFLLFTVLVVAAIGVYATITFDAGGNSPPDETVTNDNMPDFTFNATSDVNATDILCTLYINETPYGTNDSVVNDTLSTLTANDTLDDGSYLWYVNCTDDDGIVQSPDPAWNITIDTTGPTVTVVSPADGYYYGDSNVTINFSASDVYSSVDMVWFDNETSNWSVSGSSYTNYRMLEDGTYTYSFWANDSLGNEEAPEEVTFTVDAAPPTVSIASPASDTPQASLTVSFVVNVTEDNLNYTNVSIYNSTDDLVDSVVNTTDTDFAMTLTAPADDVYYLVATTYDLAGLMGNDTVTNITVDMTGPVLTVDSPVAGYYDTGSVDVNFSAVDTGVGVEAIWYTNDTGDNTTGVASPVDTAYTLTDGSYTFIFYGNDTLGNPSTPISRTFIVDETDPTVSLGVLSSDTAQASMTLTFNVTVDDTNLNYTTVTVVNSSGGVINSTNSSTNGTYELVWVVPADEVYNITAVAYDNASRYSTTALVSNITVDTTGPTITVVSPVDSYFYTNTSVVVNFTAVDTHSNVDYIWYDNGTANSTPVQDDNYTVTLTLAADTAYTFVFYANDTLNNTETPETVSFTVDTTAPTVSIDSPASNSNSTSRTINITVNVTDTNRNYTNVSIFNSSDTLISSDVNTTDDDFIISLDTGQDGVMRIMATTYDLSGQSAAVNVTNVTVDTLAPAVTQVTPASAAVVEGTSVSFDWTATDIASSVASCILTIDDVENLTTSDTNATVAGFSEGSHNWSVNCTDIFNYENASSTLSFIVDEMATSITLNYPSSDAYLNESNINFNWTVNDTNLPVNCSLYVNDTFAANDSDLDNVSTTYNWTNDTMTEGYYTWNVSCLDTTTNTYNSEVGNFTLDTTEPNSNVSGVNISAGTDGSITLNWTVDPSDDTYYYVLYKNTTSINTSDTATALNSTIPKATTGFKVTTGLVAGTTYYFVLASKDRAGNVNTSYVSSEVNVSSATCSDIFTYGSWGSCSGGERSRTGTRTCYNGGDETDTDTEECSTSSGGGGTTSSSTSTTRVSNVYTTVTANTNQYLTGTAAAVLEQVTFVLNAAAQNVRLTYDEVATLPTSVPTKAGSYKYFTLTAENIQSANLKSALIEFSVTKQWLTDNSATQDQVKLYRFVDNKWTELSTSVASADTAKVYYKATTPGFSYFAIGTKSSPPVETPVEEQVEPEQVEQQAEPETGQEEVTTAGETPPTPEQIVESQAGSSAVLWIGLIVLVLLIVGFIIYKKNKK
ncbi:MAG: PGF-pre-PGF domain-containing protein [archaeon]